MVELFFLENTFGIINIEAILVPIFTLLQQAMFSTSSRSARQTACSVIEAISQVFSRRKEVIDMLTRLVFD